MEFIYSHHASDAKFLGWIDYVIGDKTSSELFSFGFGEQTEDQLSKHFFKIQKMLPKGWSATQIGNDIKLKVDDQFWTLVLIKHGNPFN